MFGMGTRWIEGGQAKSKRRRSNVSKRDYQSETLEAREVPALAAWQVEGAALRLTMDNNGGKVDVKAAGSDLRVFDAATGRSRLFAGGGVNTIYFEGGAGADHFINHTAVSSTAFGAGGNDTLVGGRGADYLDGGLGNDQVNGRGGRDNLLGGAGDDVLISIDGLGGDYLDPWTGRDVLWIDSVATGVDRVSSALGADDMTHHVAWFANGADRTLDGDRLNDPHAADYRNEGGERVQYNLAYRAFNDTPLFSAAGPRLDDPVQGRVGDCWLIAGLSAIADDNAHAIRQRVVDFNDGTYGVKLDAKFYRVDNDLPLAIGSSTRAAFAPADSARGMWTAIVEKAYAHHRSDPRFPSYDNLNGGWSIEVNRAFGSTRAGEATLQAYGSAQALGVGIYRRWLANEAVTVGFVNNVDNTILQIPGCPCIDEHAYTVTNVTLNARGEVASIELRNPWGYDGVSADTRPSDGRVIVTPAQLFRLNGKVNWGKV